MRKKQIQHALESPGPLLRPSGFTLIEILIVVVILGILATIVIPQFSNASNQARENMLKDELRYLRTQIIVYRAQHNDIAPGVSGNFVDQMTKWTDEAGNIGTDRAVYKFGPYLSKIPTNPMTGRDDIRIVSSGSIPSPNGSTGWQYKPSTQEIQANVPGNDSNGIAFYDY